MGRARLTGTHSIRPARCRPGFVEASYSIARPAYGGQLAHTKSLKARQAPSSLWENGVDSSLYLPTLETSSSGSSQKRLNPSLGPKEQSIRSKKLLT